MAFYMPIVSKYVAGAVDENAEAASMLRHQSQPPNARSAIKCGGWRFQEKGLSGSHDG